MTPKERRDILFKLGRPNIRPLEVLDKNGYHKDVAICWLAHSKKPFYSFRETEQDGFAAEILEASRTVDLLIAEDKSDYYQNGFGPIALIGVHSDGWRFMPHVSYFPWATKKNILKITVAFLQMIRYKKQVGVCVVRSMESTANLFHHCRKFGVLHYVGVIPGGDPRGDEYIFSVKGKKTHV